MSRALFLYDNLADLAQLVASSEKAVAPAANVQNRMRQKLWRSAFGNSAHLDFTLLVLAPATHVAIVDCNLTETGEIRVQAWDDAIDGNTETLDITVSPTLYVNPLLTPSPFGDGNFGEGPFGGVIDADAVNRRNVTLIPLETPNDSRYWRLTFSDINTAYQTCSRVFIAVADQYDVNLSYDWSAEVQDRSVKKQSIGGQTYVQPREGPLVLEGSFDWISDAERTASLLRMRRFGTSRPFIASIRPSADLEGFTTTIYGTHEVNRVTHRNVNLNATPFRILEAQ